MAATRLQLFPHPLIRMLSASFGVECPTFFALQSLPGQWSLLQSCCLRQSHSAAVHRVTTNNQLPEWSPENGRHVRPRAFSRMGVWNADIPQAHPRTLLFLSRLCLGGKSLSKLEEGCCLDSGSVGASLGTFLRDHMGHSDGGPSAVLQEE